LAGIDVAQNVTQNFPISLLGKWTKSVTLNERERERVREREKKKRENFLFFVIMM